MGKAAYVPVDPRPTPRHRALIEVVVAATMTKHTIVERRVGCQVWEVRLPRGLRLRVSYYGGDLCTHRATVSVFRRGKPVFVAMRSQQLFPMLGKPGRTGTTDVIDVDVPGDWESILAEKA
jgi:hypothetical protein